MAAQITSLDANLAVDMAAQVSQGLRAPAGALKHLPTMLLYDERGLRLYDDITTHAPEYYLFGAEEEILKKKADEIVAAMHLGTGGLSTGQVVLETSHILLALSRLVEDQAQDRDRDPSVAPITYYALDLEERELQRTLGEIAQSDVGKSLQGRVETRGLRATYEQGLKFAESGGLHTRSISRGIPARPTRASFSPLSSTSATRDVSPMSESTSSASDRDRDRDFSDAATSPPSTPGEIPTPLHILFLGSSLGNFTRKDGAAFLRSLPLRPGTGDTLLIGMDHDNDKAAIEAAYADPRGYTREFIMNALKVAGRTLGDEGLFDEANWEYVNNYDVALRRHEAYFKARRPHTVFVPATQETFSFAQDEKVKIEESFKFSDTDAHTLFSEAGLRPIQRWTDSTARYSLWLLERPQFTFPLLSSSLACDSTGALVRKTFPYSSSEPRARFGVPSPQEWENLWAAWDCITRRMIPPSMLMQKPIDLRHICLFYLGHIPTFLDIHLSRLLGEPHTEPEAFKYIFERGIDPDVDDPTTCHPHSEVPTADADWPTLPAILQFQARVRARLLKLYADMDAGTLPLTRKVGRVLCMTYEHEGMHAETLLYMLLQRAGTGTIPPPEFAPPPWEALAEAWDAAAPEGAAAAGTVVLGPATVVLGHDDVEAEDSVPGKEGDVAGHDFGWDNEHPKRTVHVDAFRISWRPVTNGEFFEFYTSQQGKGDGAVALPASWVQLDGVIHVRTLYGPVPMKVAQHWPVLTSYTSLSKYVQVQGGRLPSEPELRLFLEKFAAGYEGGTNVGFRNWHPVPATTGGPRDGGRGCNGGVWEWTSTVFDKYEGFVPSKLYPGCVRCSVLLPLPVSCTQRHVQIFLGGSYATIPRIAERASLRNWYHHKYPYAWISGRVVYDV
ncbi:DUF323 domain-containing protein [Mycena pura]|uniref:DUF323 domain-containing protein n=1 Tax=Mycena pura TaxID=153505 RepID=A0AAD6VM64_9AGAR|nr:DUF323 domain-containing protein [Mycena pura]